MKQFFSFSYRKRGVVAIVFVLCIRFGEPDVSCSEGMYYEPIFAGSIRDSFIGEPYTYSLSVADFNHDGIPDFLHHWRVQGRPSITSASVWYGSGDGTLRRGWGWSESGFAEFVKPFVGDWNEDGQDDVMIWERSGTFRLYFWISKPDGNWESVAYVDVIHCMYNLPGFSLGDFDGDRHVDIIATCDTGHGYLLFGKGTGEFEKVELNIQVNNGMVICDYDGDGCDDLLIPSGESVNIYAGHKDRSSIFQSHSTILLPFAPVSSLRTDINADGIDDLVFVLATGTYTLIGESPGQFRSSFAETPTDLNPENVIAADMNGDSLMDLVSWTGAVISIFCGDGNGNFIKQAETVVPYFKDVLAAAVADMNQDGRADILVGGSYTNGKYSPELISLMGTEQAPTSTPTSTPSPTPILRPSPTATPIPSVPGAVVLSPEMNLAEEIVNAPDGSVFLLEPGIYYIGEWAPLHQNEYRIPIVQKDFSLIGMEPSQPPDVWASFMIENGTVHFQNLNIHPTLEFITVITLRNSSATLLNNAVFGTDCILYTPYGGVGTRAQKVVIIENCIATSVNLIHNSIAPGGATWDRNAPNVSIENCRDLTIDLLENNLFGSPGETIYLDGQPRETTLGGNAMEISSCTDVVLNLHSSWIVGGENTGNGIQVDNSTVNITGGTIVGGAGYSSVTATDGGIGLIAQNSSVVRLLDTVVFGGKGGDGLVPGVDGEPTHSDGSSTILWETLIPLWFRY